MKIEKVFVCEYFVDVGMAFGERMEHKVELRYRPGDPMYQKVIDSLAETERLINETLSVRSDALSLTP